MCCGCGAWASKNYEVAFRDNKINERVLSFGRTEHCWRCGDPQAASWVKIVLVGR